MVFHIPNQCFQQQCLKFNNSVHIHHIQCITFNSNNNNSILLDIQINNSVFLHVLDSQFNNHDNSFSHSPTILFINPNVTLQYLTDIEQYYNTTSTVKHDNRAEQQCFILNNYSLVIVYLWSLRNMLGNNFSHSAF